MIVPRSHVSLEGQSNPSKLRGLLASLILQLVRMLTCFFSRMNGRNEHGQMVSESRRKPLTHSYHPFLHSFIHSSLTHSLYESGGYHTVLCPTLGITIPGEQDPDLTPHLCSPFSHHMGAVPTHLFLPRAFALAVSSA